MRMRYLRSLSCLIFPPCFRRPQGGAVAPGPCTASALVLSCCGPARYDCPVMTVRALEQTDAEAVASWRYPGPWSVYDPRAGDDPLTAAAGYAAVVDGDGALVGFMCVGQEARVPGLAGADGVVDIGVGMRPDLVGHGLGPEFGAAVLEHVRGRFGDRPLRAAVQSWNERSLRLARGLGFRPVGTHRCLQDGQEVSYVLLIRPAGLRLVQSA
jgi:[ribosomal protein S18]-alanine N-acetyltransferase